MRILLGWGMSTRRKQSIHNHHEALAHMPVGAVLDEVDAALHNGPAAVLVAPPGAGKTTCVPLSLLTAGWLGGRRMLLLAPRRLAARAAARRMAALLGERPGDTVGYRVRMESRIGPATRIEVVTEGILTRMVQRDPALTGVGLVIFDEFHERSLDADLGLALCRDVQGVLNPELRLLVMSATLDPAPVAELLDGAPVIHCAGRMFSVETRYVPRAADRPLESSVVGIIRRSVAAGEGDLLVFLPGVAEIRRVHRRLATIALPRGWSVAPLHGTLPRDRQDAAIAPAPPGRHKIVLATAIAETSLTIDGIAVVVDGGLQRVPCFDPGSGMTRLATLPVSQASADQRRGRAGRLGPGICYRLWPASATPALPPHNRPEILDADLAVLALELAAWGVADPGALAWLNPPPGPALESARQLLTELEAVDESGRITAHGRCMVALPLHPRLAHMILSAGPKGMAATACDIAAVLSERDPLHFSGRLRDADLGVRLESLHAYRTKQSFDPPIGAVDPSAIRRIAAVAADLRRRLDAGPPPASLAPPGRLLAWAYPDRIAQRRTGSTGRFRLANGRGAFFATPEPLGASDYLVAARLDGDRRDAKIFMAAAIDKQDVVDLFAHRIHWHAAVDWDERRQAVAAIRRQTLGALILASETMPRPSPQAVAAAMINGVRRMGIGSLPWTRSLRTWQARVLLLRRLQAEGGPWPDVSDAALMETLEDWLAPVVHGAQRLSDIPSASLAGALRSRLSWQQQRRLDDLAPTHLTVPSGSRLPIDYGESIPVLAVRLQEMFGLTATPAIVGGRLPVMLHLLSPAGRPVQITDDMAGFWRRAYPQVRKEIRGRYPKHAWPEDPVHAVPTARTKPRRGR